MKKSRFPCDQVPDVGHLFIKTGIMRPDEAKVTAMNDMPAPQSPEARHRFLDMINYLSSSVMSARRLLPCANCHRETSTEAGKHLVQKLDTSTPKSLSSIFLRSLPNYQWTPQRLVLLAHTYRMVALWHMPKEPWLKLKINAHRSRRNCLQHYFMILSMVGKPY